MAKTATVTKTKTATKAATTKTKAKKTDDNGEKKKREPSAYNIFVRTNLPKWNEAHPDRKKEGMGEVAKLWANAEENPNRGKPVTKKGAPKAAKEAKPKAAAAKSKSKSKAKKDADEEEEEAAEEEDDEEKENEIRSSDE
ncbi:hypothetical protein B0H12DRAFT_217902 [Mycena haematopus]|nr:hypothetical protein B0H12DRAFT_217902 [Mycena haematopus]